ncbi:MAG: DNA primase [Oceanicaulis sp.]
MAIPDGFIDEIKARIRPSDLIGRTVALKRQGREFAGLSPFKKERTPSFFVNDEKGFYHCFASQEHGDIFTWLQKTQGLSFMEAVEALAAEAGLDVPKDEQRSPQAEAQRKSLLEWIEAAQTYFVRQLQSPAGEEARGYLERRGLTAKDMERFGLGFAPDSRRGLTQVLRQKGAKADELAEAGLVIQPDDGGEPYDRFRGRVMFPITDTRGRLVAFGGRALSKEARAKYLNSPETPLFHKGSILYRYHEARAFASDPKVKARGLIVAEGYMDVIAFARAGLGQAVAPLGTALTENQIKLLWRAGPEPVVCLDGDAAGVRAAALAAERALPLLEPGKTLRFVFLEDGADPDDLLREKGAEALKDAISGARPLIDVIWEREVAAEPLDDPDRRAGFRKRLRALAAKIEDPDVKTEYRAELEARMETLFARAQPMRAKSGGFQRGGGKNWRRVVSAVSMPNPETKSRVEAAGKPVRAATALSLLIDALYIPTALERGTELLSEIDMGEINAFRDYVLNQIDSAPFDVAQIKSLLKREFPEHWPRVAQRFPFMPELDAGEAESLAEEWFSKVQFMYYNGVADIAREDAKRATHQAFEQGDIDIPRGYDPRRKQK